MARILPKRGRLIVLLVVAALLLGALTIDVKLHQIEPDDHSTPEIPAGSRVLVTPVEADQLVPEILCLAPYGAEGESPTLRLVRVVGLPGERIHRDDRGVSIGGRPLAIPAHVGSQWPPEIPDDHVLLLTDEPFVPDPLWLHPDSRQLGAIPVEHLVYRVVARIPF